MKKKTPEATARLDAEVEAMAQLLRVLEGLSPEARMRAVSFALQRLQPKGFTYEMKGEGSQPLHRDPVFGPLFGSMAGPRK